MPEGDTVWLAARRLDAALAGKVLRRSDFRVPSLATVDLAGRTVTGVASRGKHLLLRLDDGRTLHTHLRMDGSWHLYRPGERRRGGPDHQVRVVLETDDTVAVGYRLPVVALLPPGGEDGAVGHLGPDLLGPDWDPAEAVRRLRERPEREVAPALLDQRNLAGIGNLYKSEVLFLRGVSPWTPVRDVADLPALVTLAQRLLHTNREHWSQVTTGDRRPGRDHWVFERPGRPCRRCGTPVRSAEQAEPDEPERARLTYWCPHCQPGPAPA
ncbi:MAG TPA: DNA-formamidopyrimidine glycosylase family protein [Mycobacteriales bacterium]|jgi:endonuclease-8|nr:DNA-formamidopyrimidine glycosylase family protein [Mycobacteriales bacterium]